MNIWRITIIALFSLMSLEGKAQQLQIDSLYLSSFVDSLFENGVSEGLIPGGIIGIHSQGRTIHKGAYGQANLSLQTNVDFESTRFQLGSVGKLFTAIAVLKEVERGRLSLDADVNTYLEEFQVSEFNEEPITLRHLLLHTAGFNERVIGYGAKSVDEIEPLGDHLKRRMPTTFIPPGEEISYSNYGFGLAGHLVELSSGMKFQDYIKSEILDVLSMGNTTYHLPDVDQENFAMGYELNQGFDFVAPFPRHVVPAGSISSTGDDMMKLIQAILSENPDLLSKTSFGFLNKQQFTPHPLISGHGLGTEFQNFNGHLGFGKGGNIPGFIAYIIMFPQYDLGMFVTVNTETDNFLETFNAALKDEFFPRLHGQPERFLDNVDLSEFTGVFRANRYNRNTIEDLFGLLAGTGTIYSSGDTTLTLYHNGQWQHYKPIEPMVFQNISEPELHLVFEKNAKGKVGKLHRNIIIAGFSIPITLVPVRWYESVNFVNEYAGFFPIMILSYLLFPLGWLVIWLMRKRKDHFMKGKTFSSTTRLIVMSFTTLVAIHVVGSIYQIIKTGNDLIFGIPDRIVFWQGLSFLLPPMLVVVFYRVIKAWRAKEGQLGSRIYLTLFTFSGVVYLLILHRWHFIGLNF